MKDINYRLGLDIGITSVGWAVINLDKQRIEDLGVRIFNAAEQPKTGASLALPRREARGRRRLLRRKAYRISRVKKLLISKGVITEEEYNKLFDTRNFTADIWELRSKGLDEKLTSKEWTRILVNLSKRRGFRSNRKNEAKDKEAGQLISNISNNMAIMNEKGYRTVGEMIFKESKFSNDPYEAKRNKAGKYNKCVSRKMIEDEVKKLFETQRDYGNKYASKEMEQEYLLIFNSQRPFSNFEELEKLVGYCTLEKKNGYKRAPKNSLSAEEFILYSSLNNLSIKLDGKKRSLTQEERDKICDLAFNKSEVKYSTIRKAINLSENERFSTLSYNKKGEIDKTESTKFVSLRGTYEIKKAIQKSLGKNYWEEIKYKRELLNNIAYVLTLGKTDIEIESEMKKRNIPEEIINAVMDISFTGFINLSIQAIDKIIPYLKEGLTYDKACKEVGYNFKAEYDGEKFDKLPLIDKDEIINPVVIRALSQTRKVVNAIISKYGSPVGINVELARELAKGFKDRQAIKKKHDESKVEKEKIRKELEILIGKSPTSMEMLKYRLWKQQKEECPYTQKKIYIEDLFKPGYYEIDHIIPFSRCFDDSLNNKVLVKGVENQRKSNRTPFEYFGGDSERWHKFEVWVEESNLNYAKKDNLLIKKFGEEEGKDFKERNLNDTRNITSYIFKFIGSRLKFKESNSKQKVVSVNGRATAYLRAKWGLVKVREDGDKHHALDAAVVAVTTQGMVQKISKYSKAKELKYIRQSDEFVDIETGEIVKLEEYRYLEKDNLPRPWEGFSGELEARLSDNPIEDIQRLDLKSYDKEFLESVKPIFVSRVPQRKVGGKMFKETIYSQKAMTDKGCIVKKKLVDLKEKDIMNIYNYNSDKKLYDAILERYNEFNGDAKKAFSEPFRKPTRSGKLGPIVNSIKVITALPFKDGVEQNKGLVAKEGIARVDVYKKDKSYYMVPVYRKDIALGVTPKKAALSGKSEKDWTQIDESFKFTFSLFKNDLVEIIYEKKEGFFGYFEKFDRGTASLTIKKHDGKEPWRGVGVKSGVKEFNKYTVDTLGNYYKIKEGVFEF